jgi:LuxR family transcriptional regulator, maltose regulon positive regulatory protein
MLFGRLGDAERVTVISGPAGSGKTTLVRSWIDTRGLADSTAWVLVHADECDERGFWIPVANALHGAGASSLTVHPGMDGWTVAGRLLADLDSSRNRIWLVIDDMHQLRSADALRQLEFVLMRSPRRLRIVLLTRHDLRLGLHRLRLDGELTEIRAADLRFTIDESRTLLETAGLVMPEPALRLLTERTEGWAAGLRLAALSLTGHPDLERFAAEFTGSERTVAEYLEAEVLQGQPEEVGRLLRRTSVLDRVSGSLADALTGGSRGERILQELEACNSFVISLDARRSWFRYHQMFADVLRLELRREEPWELPALHRAASCWYAQHGYPAEASRHAQTAQEPGPASDDAVTRADGDSGPRALERAIALISLGIAEFWSMDIATARERVSRAVATLDDQELAGAEAHDALALLRLTLGNPDAGPRPAHQALSRGETRVLRYLPTNLPTPEIASELSVSVTTVRTHVHHIYAKLGAHSRAEAVQLARTAGLLTRS